MSNIHAVVLAAGQGTRMKSKLHKVLHPICGKPMVKHVIDTLGALQVRDIIVVIGYGADAVRAAVGEQVNYAVQAEQLGTAHAVQQAVPFLAEKEGTTLILYGDVPLLSKETLAKLIACHETGKAAATVMTAYVSDPAGYGRVVRDDDGNVVKIVEHKDASQTELAIREVNTGIYCFENRKLLEAISQVTNQNAQGEYYITDCIEILRRAGEKVGAFVTDDPEEANGVNDRVQLAQAEAYMRKRIQEKHMKNGVTIVDPSATYIDADVVIGNDTVVYPGSLLRGNTVIGSDCRIGPQADLTDVIAGDGVHVTHSVLVDCRVENQATIGPFAYVRPQSHIGEKVKIGDFVELKNAQIGTGSKIPHHSYIGDAEIGAGVNIGCGTITVNYDGAAKHRTVVEDHAFIGCNTNLVAPVRVGKGAYVAAGSTITQNVPDEALAIARERQVNKPGYAAQLPRKQDKTD